ncbi:GNAT family N-acetyltransferase [Stappia indica]|uniref:GNAT family N-acetyltransferase n=1 Tax=Stappia indica TaxID=538381 RepID=A0A857C883_9HYPH|nr:GNAT family N-acetyltransferase [Stappia indica]QGZ35085.1 GNAT family N-acetyltransferase [Stappia indica]
MAIAEDIRTDGTAETGRSGETAARPHEARSRRRKAPRQPIKDARPSKRGDRAMTVLVFRAGEAEAHLPHWRALAETALEPNPFFGPDFLLSYLAHMQSGEVHILAVRDAGDGSFLALVPFLRRRAGLAVPIVAACAGDYGPLGTPLLSPSADSAVLSLLLDTAAQEFGTRTFLIPYLRTDGPVSELFDDLAAETGWHVARTAKALRAGHAAGPTGEEQFRLIGTRRRKELDRQLRRLEEANASAEFGSVSGAEEVKAAFEQFLALEAAGWKGRRGTALASTPERAAFARAFISSLSARGRVRIDTLGAGEAPAAMLVTLRDRDRVFSWKIAYDEQLARFSPGAQVARQAMRRNLDEAGFSDADSLAIPDHPMIAPLWRGSVPFATLVVSKGAAGAVRGALARLDIAADRRLRKLARTLLARLRKGRD